MADSDLDKLASAIPGYEIGDAVHDAYVRKLKVTTPGGFRERLFPDIGGPLVEQVAARTGLRDSWWADLATAAVCQAIAWWTTEGKHVNGGAADQAVTSHNADLRSRSRRFYGYVLAQQHATTKEALLVLGRDAAAAAAAYQRLLLESVNVERLWRADGMAKNPEWRLFHHLVKLELLGVPEADLDALLQKLRGAGLPIPSSLDQGAWKTYSGFLASHWWVDGHELQDALPALKASRTERGVTPVTTGSHPPMPWSVTYEEYTAVDFMSGPGSGYQSSGSCFAAGTRILLADGSCKPIEALRAGERVAGREGPCEVAFVITLPRGNRELYQLRGTAMEFTATHPFVCAGRAHRLACVQPTELQRHVPSLLREGVGALDPGARLLQVPKGDVTRTVEVSAPALERSARAPQTNEPVYDVIVRPGPGRSSSYLAGDGKTFWVVASELADFARCPEATLAGIVVLDAVLAEVNRGPTTDTACIERQLRELRGRISGELLHRALVEACTADTERRDADPGSLSDRLQPHMAQYVAADGSGAPLPELVYRTIGESLLGELEHLIDLGWRSHAKAAGPCLSVSLGELVTASPIDQPPRCVGVRLLAGHRSYESRLVECRHPVAKGSHAFQLGQVVGFDRHYPLGLHVVLELELFLGAQERPLVGQVPLPLAANRPFALLSTTIMDHDRRHAGWLTLDARLLQSGVSAAEQQRRRWSPTQRWAWAMALGDRLGAHAAASLLEIAQAPAGT